jgi:HupH hydrogenase expression protein, C-terminal conserved region
MAHMTRLSDIGITVIADGPEPIEANGNALPVLSEIETMLTKLVDEGRPDAIDLRSLPMLPGDYARLQDALGRGEVRATIDALGASEVYETGIHGVWWVIHRNLDGDTTGEFIEVTWAPEILTTPRADAKRGLQQLRDRIRDATTDAEGEAND